jgi:hypothetical protein
MVRKHGTLETPIHIDKINLDIMNYPLTFLCTSILWVNNGVVCVCVHMFHLPKHVTDFNVYWYEGID